MDLKMLAATMNVVAAEVQTSIKAGHKAGLSQDAAVIAAMIGVISYIRVAGLREDVILSEVRKVVPVSDPSNTLIFTRKDS